MENYRLDHIKPVLIRLHWLSIRGRVTFKIATKVVKIRRAHQPSHSAYSIDSTSLSGHFDPHPSGYLRSRCFKQLLVVVCSGIYLPRRGTAQSCGIHKNLSNDFGVRRKLYYSDTHTVIRWFPCFCTQEEHGYIWCITDWIYSIICPEHSKSRVRKSQRDPEIQNGSTH